MKGLLCICVVFVIVGQAIGSPFQSIFCAERQREIDSTLVTAGELGKVRGFLTKTKNGGCPFVQFNGIPYAHSPVGERRFMPAELRSTPLAEGGREFNATDFGNPCPQWGGGTEDCLFLNIATATANTGVLAPVIVYIHGAAFVAGRANEYDGQRLLNENLVVVSFNYRLGVVGYLGFASDIAPGNGGLYDALTVLQWIQKYISYFGGDPNLVTISGQSSGSASVTHLMLSPLSKGLFHRAIALSGTALNGWGTTVNPRPYALRIAGLVGCSNSTALENNLESRLPEIMRCLRSVSVTELIKAQTKFQSEERKAGKQGFGAVNPAITFDSLKVIPTLLPDYPANILKRREQMNVPLMIGATKQDGELSLGIIYNSYLVPNDLWKNGTLQTKDFVPYILDGVDFHTGDNESRASFTKAYLENCSESGDFFKALPGLMDMCTVLFFKEAALKVARLHSTLNNTFLYSFDFKGTHTRHNPTLPFPGGVAHSDDTIYLFNRGNFEFNAEEEETSNNMISIWANFAKTGAPTTKTSPVAWPAYSQNQSYVRIEQGLIVDTIYENKWIGASRNDFGPYEC